MRFYDCVGLNERSEIFTTPECAVEALRRRDLISKTRQCTCCTSVMSLQVNKKTNNKYSYVCLSRKCRKQVGLFYNTLFSEPNVPIHNYLFAIYKWLENSYEKDVLRNSKISKKSFSIIKKHLLNWCKQKNIENYRKLGGKKKQVQVDETAVCHGLLPASPSNLPDDFPGVSWLMGFIEIESNDIILECLENRTAGVFEKLFKKNLEAETIVVTDGHRSYPTAVAAVNGKHIIVNHSLGFKNEAGDHTNNIENLWSQLKYEIKKRRGIKRSNFTEFLEEWTLRYSCLKTNTDENLLSLFFEIIEYLIKTK